MTRRRVLEAAGAGAAAAGVAACQGTPTAAQPGHIGAAMPNPNQQIVSVTLHLNGQPRTLELDPRTTLLDAVRDHVGLTGSKKGCDHGQCGACTMLVEGRRINSCLTLAVMHDGENITTIEGFAEGESLHPLQRAFIEHDGFQCGYCTPGQICSAAAMLTELRAGMPSHVSADLKNVSLSADEVRERMSGNLCRCAAYPNIVAAILDVAKQG
jgi:xanthine dehydrogenase YagT iron-sulfur-binding subunit